MAAAVLGRWIQHCVPKLCKIGKYLSLMDIMHSPDAILVHLFSGHFEFFYHEKVSHNKSKKILFSLIPSFLFGQISLLPFLFPQP